MCQVAATQRPERRDESPRRRCAHPGGARSQRRRDLPSFTLLVDDAIRGGGVTAVARHARHPRTPTRRGRRREPATLLLDKWVRVTQGGTSFYAKVGGARSTRSCSTGRSVSGSPPAPG
jgi:hypothetical protein